MLLDTCRRTPSLWNFDFEYNYFWFHGAITIPISLKKHPILHMFWHFLQHFPKNKNKNKKNTQCLEIECFCMCQKSTHKYTKICQKAPQKVGVQ